MKAQGILPDNLRDPEFIRQCEEHEQQLAQEREERAAEAERAAELQAVYDEIEAAVLPHVREQAKEVNSSARIKPGDKRIFDEFKEYLRSWNPPLPAIPAHPASVAAFLAKDLGRGTSHFMKRFQAISRLHLAVGMPDPTRDVLCASLKALVRKNPKSQQQKGK